MLTKEYSSAHEASRFYDLLGVLAAWREHFVCAANSLTPSRQAAKRSMRPAWPLLLGICLLAIGGQAQTPPEMTGTHITENVSPSVVLILTGQGAGQTAAVGSGLIVRADGIVLTAYHLVKDAREVQVRLKSGEIYDKVELIGADERRDVAALRLPAVNLPVLSRADAAETRVGMPVYTISHPQGLPWSVSNGLLSAVRLADDVPGAGQGYQLLQHTAPVSAGSSGGVLVDEYGHALGLIVASAGGQNVNFAVPLNSVLGLANATQHVALGEGKSLSPPTPIRPPEAAAILKTDPQEILRTAKIIYVSSNTSYFEAVQLQNELRKLPEFREWQLLIVDDWQARKSADLEIEVDRPLFTFDFTYKITAHGSGVVVATGKEKAWDGHAAAPKLAKRIIADIKHVRTPPVAPKATAEKAKSS